MRELESGNSPYSTIIFDQQAQTVKFDEFKLARYKQRLGDDFNRFERCKQYVIDNVNWLQNRQIPVEVRSIQVLPSYEAVIVNDMVMYSYSEMEEIIKNAKDVEEKIRAAQVGGVPKLTDRTEFEELLP